MRVSVRFFRVPLPPSACFVDEAPSEPGSPGSQALREMLELPMSRPAAIAWWLVRRFAHNWAMTGADAVASPPNLQQQAQLCSESAGARANGSGNGEMSIHVGTHSQIAITAAVTACHYCEGIYAIICIALHRLGGCCVKEVVKKERVVVVAERGLTSRREYTTPQLLPLPPVGPFSPRASSRQHRIPTTQLCHHM